MVVSTGFAHASPCFDSMRTVHAASVTLTSVIRDSETCAGISGPPGMTVLLVAFVTTQEPFPQPSHMPFADGAAKAGEAKASTAASGARRRKRMVRGFPGTWGRSREDSPESA